MPQDHRNHPVGRRIIARCALGSLCGGPRRVAGFFVLGATMRPLGDVSGVVVIPLANERFIVLDELDYDRMCAVTIDCHEYRIRPSEAKWRAVSNKGGQVSAGTTVPGPEEQSVVILLQWLICGTSSPMRPSNKRRLDCRRCNWKPTGEHRTSKPKPCPVCGMKRPGPGKLKKSRMTMLTYRFYNGRLMPFVACSDACKAILQRKLPSVLGAAEISSNSKSVVYFLSDGRNKAVKIGYSADLAKRMSSLQTGNRRDLTLLGAIPGTRADESSWHTQFAELRLRGEWFLHHPSLLKAIDDAVQFARLNFPRPGEQGALT